MEKLDEIEGPKGPDDARDLMKEWPQRARNQPKMEMKWDGMAPFDAAVRSQGKCVKRDEMKSARSTAGMLLSATLRLYMSPVLRAESFCVVMDCKDVLIYDLMVKQRHTMSLPLITVHFIFTIHVAHTV